MRPPTISKPLYWTPRILSMIFIGFLTLFSLDVTEMGLGFWGTVGAFLIHSIPSFILLALLIVSWKREIVGGVGFIVAGLVYIGLLMRNPFEWYLIAWALQISGIAFLVGILFLVGWKKRKSITKL